MKIQKMNSHIRTSKSTVAATLTSSNQVGIREHNERLVLTTLRRKGALPKADIARETGLSAQAASVIVRSLESDGLLTKGERNRGKIGQPSIPIKLDPDGTYFLGLKVGRRSAELILINFLGDELSLIIEQYNFPTPEKIISFVIRAIDEICEVLPTENREKISGLGIATPYFLWEWANIIGIDADEMKGWLNFDLRAEISKHVSFPVYLSNDASSACGAELTFGNINRPSDFLYIYIGYFIGGGIVLNGALYDGKSGNAGALGPFPMQSSGGTYVQLVERASLISLEREISKHRKDPKFEMTSKFVLRDGEDKLVEEWAIESALAIAHLIIGACSIIDFPMVVIDGKIPLFLREKILFNTSSNLDAISISGIEKPKIQPGTLGDKARALGAASLPLSKKFMLEG